MSYASTISMAVVDAPPAEVPVVGLIAAAKATGQLLDADVETTVYDAAAQRWETGYRYLPEQSCSVGTVSDPCSNVTTLTIPGNPSIVEEVPALIAAGDHCSSFGWGAHNFQQRAINALLASESKLAATEFWTGTQAQASSWPNLYLANSSTIVVTGGAQTPSAALALLEEAIAQTSNGGPAAIHCTRQLGSILSELGNTLRNVAGQIVTYNGTVIIPDAGYPGTGPGGVEAAGTQWAYATLLPWVRRSPIQLIPETMEEALDRSTNTIEWRAERYIGTTVPPCTVVACEVSLGLPTLS